MSDQLYDIDAMIDKQDYETRIEEGALRNRKLVIIRIFKHPEKCALKNKTFSAHNRWLSEAV